MRAHEVTPAAHVRVVLTHHRDLGTEFVDAWAASMRTLPRGTSPESKRQLAEWKAALEWARPAYHAAYLRERAAVLTDIERLAA